MRGRLGGLGGLGRIFVLLRRKYRLIYANRSSRESLLNSIRQALSSVFEYYDQMVIPRDMAIMGLIDFNCTPVTN